jgi:hypothetical protein
MHSFVRLATQPISLSLDLLYCTCPAVAQIANGVAVVLTRVTAGEYS